MNHATGRLRRACRYAWQDLTEESGRVYWGRGPRVKKLAKAC
jgi:hypothetical protein